MENINQIRNLNSRRFEYKVKGGNIYSTDIYLPGLNENIEKGSLTACVMKRRDLEGEYVLLGHYACLDRY